MASPHVAGVIALIESTHAGAVAQEDDPAALPDTRSTPPCGGAPDCEGTPENNGFYGRGVVNALNAVS